LRFRTKYQREKNDAYVGRVERVLVDGVSKNNDNMLSGRCDSSKIVNFKGDNSLVGKYVNVKITEAHTWSLNGELFEEGGTVSDKNRKDS
jgi:tRNA-2-methylthio-N6-dimethylallyladenosine synthase